MGWIFGSQSINLLHHRQDAIALAQLANHQSGLGHVAQFLFQSHGTGNLEIRESINLCGAQQFLVEHIDALAGLQGFIYVDDVLQLVEEPLVNLGQFVYLVDGITLVHGLGDDEDTLVGRFAESLVDVVDFKLLVFHKTVHALSYHAQTLLDGFLKVAANGHHLAYRLHG